MIALGLMLIFGGYMFIYDAVHVHCGCVKPWCDVVGYIRGQYPACGEA